MPAHEVAEQPQAGLGALLGVELDGEDVIPRHRTGKGDAIHRRAGDDVGPRRLDVIAVHEIEAAAVGDAVADYIRPVRTRFDEIRADVPTLTKILKEGAEKAQHTARRTVRKVYKKVGFWQPEDK